jgi:hypothetical protein
MSGSRSGEGGVEPPRPWPPGRRCLANEGAPKTLVLGLVLGIAAGSGVGAQTLREGVKSAWRINLQIATLAAKREAIAARRVAAQSWFPGPPSITFSHVSGPKAI